MASAQDIQSLLRFLSQDAKIPLAQALGKVKELQAAKLNTPIDLSNADFEQLKKIFGDGKVARQVLNAAKRSKKRKSTDDNGSLPAPSPKKPRPALGQALNPSEFEASLELPEAVRDEKTLESTVLYTNRAPLVLAFATTLLKYTMPEQPISSRLSLAQAVTSMNSKNKALHLGIESGNAAEDEGWGEGQPLIKVMTRDIRVMKRWGYEWEEAASQSTMAASSSAETLISSPATLVEEPQAKEPALWGIDLEALKKHSDPLLGGGGRSSSSNLPIFTAQSARSYLLKAFDSPKDETTSGTKKASAKSISASKERNLGRLLGALELLYESWHILSKDELNKRAWGWYVRVRPDVAAGVAGWGGKGNVKLSDILELRRP